MYIKNLYIKKFGKLHDISISFDEGLNIIEGRNEAGKSTVAAFIKFMLYGSPKDRATKENPLPEKEKYIPWDSDGTASGTLTVDYKGRSIVIEREFKKSQNKKLGVYDEATGEPLDIFNTGEPGRSMFDISADTFERTAFIRQSDLVLGECSELEIKLRNLVTGADENVSYSKASGILENLRKRLENSRGGGIIPEIKARIEKLKSQLSTACAVKLQYDEIMQSIKALKERKEELEETLEKRREELCNAQNYIKYEKYQKIKAAREQQHECLARRDAVMRNLVVGESIADEAYLRKIRQSSHDLRLHEERLSMCRQDMSEGKNRLSSIKRELDSFGKLSEDYETTVDRLENAPKTRTRILLPSGGVTAAFGVMVLTAYFIFGRSLILLIPSMIILLTGLILIFLHFVVKRPNSPETISKEYGFKSSSSLGEALGRVSQIKKEYDNACALLQEAYEREAQQVKICDDTRKILSEFCKARGVEFVSPSAVDMLCGSMEEDLHRAEMLDMKYDQIEERINDLLDGADEKELSESSFSGTEKPRDTAIIEAELDALSAEYNKLSLDCVHLEHKAETMFCDDNSPDKIAGELEEKKIELSQKQRDLAACDIAAGALQEAFTELQMSFAPELNNKAGGYFTSLTRNNKRELLMDANAVVRIRDEGIIRELSYFSAGTRDSAYFSVRLAAADLIFGNERPPLIFDDTFARLDNVRLRQVIETLCGISEAYQILLFTCREEDKAQVTGGYKLINI